MIRNRRASRIYWLRVKIFFIILFVISFLGLIYWFIFLSPYFQIKEITIEGFNQSFSKKIELILEQNNRRFTPFLIYEIFPQYLENNKSYATFFNSDLEKLLLKQYPKIEKIDIRWDIRKATLTINIQQRTIDFLWCIKDGGCYYMDKNGVIFEKALETQGSFLKRIVILHTKKRSLSDKVISQDKLEKIDKIFILTKNKESSISIDFLEIKEEDFSSIKIVVNEGFYILYNLTDDFSEVLKIITEIKKQKLKDDFSNLEYIDCRYLPKVYLSN
jgi:cell division septal protein FtsQ